MKVCIVSDSHGMTERMEQVIRRHPDIDLLIHAGDHANDAKTVQDLTVKTVCGNCDHPDSAVSEELFGLHGIRLLVTHGHKYRVKESLLPLLYRAKEAEAEIVVFGHSHVPVIVEEEGILLLNPGSLSYPRGGFQVPSYSILEMEPSEAGVQVSIQHYDLNGVPMIGFAVKKVFSNK